MIFNDTFPTRATHYQGHLAHKISRVKDISGPRFRKPRPAPGKNVRTKVSCFEHAVFARKPRFMKRSTNFDWPQATVRVTINGVATINSTREVPGDNHTSREHIFWHSLPNCPNLHRIVLANTVYVTGKTGTY